MSKTPGNGSKKPYNLRGRGGEKDPGGAGGEPIPSGQPKPKPTPAPKPKRFDQGFGEFCPRSDYPGI